MAAEQIASKEEPKPKKSLWDIVITSTPVLMTVLATLLASRSSSEMTQAQYSRSIAAQNQSKAGDQWSFFQAKRVRGTVQQMFSERGAFRPASALAVANRLPRSVERTGAETKSLLGAVDAAEKSTDDAGPGKADLDAVKAAVAKYEGQAKKAAEDLQKTQKELAALLGTSDLSFDLAAPKDEPTKSSNGEPRAFSPRDFVDMAIDPEVREVVVLIRAMEAGKSSGEAVPSDNPELTKKIKSLPETKIRRSIEAAEAKSAKFDKSTDATTNAIRKAGDLLTKQSAVVRTIRDAAEDVLALVENLNGPAGKSADVRKAAEKLQASTEAMVNDAGAVLRRFKAAQCDYEFRRYDREARFNQEVAGLYELEVRKATVEADRHISRSMSFMYAMLAAQAGVTIATFSLAVQQKSILWALATAAGVTAISIGIAAFVSI